jgi:hypothetical protein
MILAEKESADSVGLAHSAQIAHGRCVRDLCEYSRTHGGGTYYTVIDVPKRGAHNLFILLNKAHPFVALKLPLYLVNASFGRTK